ncbi:Ger(x)C family spore germination C-terminal domain-containing protein [Desertibacillus haloalkaliphilus]|nr:Ger(x)C family spore germination C-terminal domain-containing protein [Desertibacillus haloalkaliphilus]
MSLLVLCSGCQTDLRELDDRSLILGLAIDKGDVEEYSVGVQIPIFGGAGSSGGAELTREFEVKSEEGDSIQDALANIEAITPTVLFLGQLKVVTISEEVAKENLEPVLDQLSRDSAIASRVLLLVIKEVDAETFINTESPLVNLPSLYLDRFFDADQKIGRSRDTKLFEYLRDSTTVSRAATIPVGTLTEEGLMIEGMGVFKDHQLVGELAKSEVSVSQLLKNERLEFMNYSITLEEEGEEIKVALTRVEFTPKLSFQKTNPVQFELELRGSGDVVELSRPMVEAEIGFIKKIEEKMEEEIKAEVERTITKMQELNVEPWLLGQRIWVDDYEFYEELGWHDSGWQNAEFNVSVDFTVQVTGQKEIFQKKKVGR